MATTDNSGVRGSGSQRKSGGHSSVNLQQPPKQTTQATAAAAQLKKTKSLLDASIIDRRRKRMERGVLIGAVSFIALVGFAIWYDDGSILKASLAALRSLENDSYSSSSAIENCQNPKNRNTPYCQDRIAETEQTWNSIVKHDKKSPAFTLHGR